VVSVSTAKTKFLGANKNNQIIMRKIEVTTENYQGFSGDIIVTDPCYFIPDDIWQELIRKFWYPDGRNASETAHQGTIYIDDTIKILYTSTAYGDGEYRVDNNSGQCVHTHFTGVDAGMIAIITVADAQKLNPEFDVNDNRYPRINGFTGGIEADGEGNFDGDIIVDTQPTREDEEDDYYNEWNEEDQE
jgi:hypothetical protein